jgi:hypothetical protein
LPTSSLRPGQGPHSGDDTYDLTGHALRRLAERRGAWPGDNLTASLTGQAGRFLPELVTSARLNGHTRHDITQALATSPDEARRRSGPGSPVAGGRWPYDTSNRKGGATSSRHNSAKPAPGGGQIKPGGAR